MIFSSVRNARRGQWRNTAELRLLVVSISFWAILAIRMYREGIKSFSYFFYTSILNQSPRIIASKKHRLEVWTAVGNCGQLLITWTPVEYFRKFRHCRPYWYSISLISMPQDQMIIALGWKWIALEKAAEAESTREFSLCPLFIPKDLFQTSSSKHLWKNYLR